MMQGIDRWPLLTMKSVICGWILMVVFHGGWVRAGDKDRQTGKTYYVDPVQGSMTNDGSSGRPWRTLEEVVAKGLISTWAYATPYQPGTRLVRKNAEGIIQAGDTIVLREGHHGQLRIRGAVNAEVITIKAQAGHRATLSQIWLTAVSKWHLESLTVSPSLADAFRRAPMIHIESHGFHGPSDTVTVRSCRAYSVEDTVNWTLKDWNTLACNGLDMDGDRMVAEKNHLLNVNFGISISGDQGRVTGNTVENFAGDGMRGLGNDLLFDYNLVKNCYNVNDNHDDGFQSWSIRYDPPRERIVLRGNTIINYEDPNQPFRGPLQGIGCFDGPFVDWVIENNLVIIDHYHGISMYGAYNCRIVNNTVVDLNTVKPGPPWIRINPHKDKTPSEGCLIRNNIAPKIVATAGVTEDHNYRLRTNDAFFLDPRAFNFRLKANAPVIDAGTSDLASKRDRDGHSRPQGLGVDIGAYEYLVDSDQ